MSTTTLDPVVSVPGSVSTRRVPALTIAAHPDPRRIGQRYLSTELLGQRALRISRAEPVFETEPLRDPYLSRDAFTLTIDPGGLRVDARGTSAQVIAAGEVVAPATWIPLAMLEPGVVLELAGRVVLVVHWTEPGPPPASRHGLVGASLPMLELGRAIERAAPHLTPVLVRGESGSGKELVARAIHQAGPRASGPFLAVNMAAVPATTAVAELFGHEKGAFTGATSAQPGWFGRAHGGTLFLDEIGETPDAVQPMLLRALETGEIQPVGAQAVRQLDVRVVAATDADLDAMCEAGRFRFPLLQRLAGQTLLVPPLRARRSDLGTLLAHFLSQELSEELARLGSEAKPWLGASIVARALGYRWPGNVRELRNFARELADVSRGRSTAKVGPIFEAAFGASADQGHAGASAEPPPESEPPRGPLTDEAMVAALRQHQFRVSETARALGISKNTLYQAMERCDGVRKARDLTRPEVEAALTACGGDPAAAAARLEVSERGLKLRLRELGLNRSEPA